MIPLFGDMMGPQQLMEIGRESELIAVQNFVNQKLLGELTNDFDVLEHAAAKALYFTGNDNLEKAIDWVERNRNNIDFNKPMNVSRFNQFMGRFDQFGGFPQQIKRKTITKEMKEREKNLPGQIDKWKEKLEAEGEPQQLKEFYEVMTKEDSLDDLLRKKSTGEWIECEINMTKSIEHMKEEVKAAYLTEVKQSQKLLKNNAKKETKADLFNEVIEMFCEEDISDTESDKNQEKIEKAMDCIDSIYNLSEDKQESCLTVLKEILNGLLTEPENYKIISKNNERFKKHLMITIGALKLLEIIGYKNADDKLAIEGIDKDLIQEIVEFIGE